MEPTKIEALLAAMYGPAVGAQTARRLMENLAAYQAAHPLRAGVPFTQQDAIVITYGDQFQKDGEPALGTLGRFFEEHLRGLISGVHILPFFPYTSDDGFSVQDYRAIQPAWGSWEDIHAIAGRFRLMLDLVINHCSQQHAWFQAFLRDEAPGKDYFIVADPETDLRQVVRPRALPLLSAYETPAGQRWVWTTFSADQVDLNYQNPDVLLEMIDVLLFYAAQGAQVVRLDAIAYLWKEIGTRCLHLPQTHAVVRLMRAVLNQAAPQVALITETNVPHEENLSYFGDGQNEAQMVYNFSLPPLTLHALLNGTAEKLTEWAKALALPSAQVTFFNFLASHDGIGLNPALGILSRSEIAGLAAHCLAMGGGVSEKNNPDGSTSPYELNINYLDALGGAGIAPETAVKRFLCAQAILLAMKGVPGIYIHSLLGSRGWQAGVEITGVKRTINRQKFDEARLVAELAQPGSERAQIFGAFRRMLSARAAQPAFDPYGIQQVLSLHPAVFGLLRRAQNGGPPVVCLNNLSDAPLRVDLSGLAEISGPVWKDILAEPAESGGWMWALAPYQTRWLTMGEH